MVNDQPTLSILGICKPWFRISIGIIYVAVYSSTIKTILDRVFTQVAFITIMLHCTVKLDM